MEQSRTEMRISNTVINQLKASRQDMDKCIDASVAFLKNRRIKGDSKTSFSWSDQDYEKHVSPFCDQFTNHSRLVGYITVNTMSRLLDE